MALSLVAKGGRGGYDPTYIHRPLQETAEYLAAQRTIAHLLTDPYLFRRRRHEGVTLLEGRILRRATRCSAYIQSLSPRLLSNQLMATLPETSTKELRAVPLGLKPLGENGSQLVILLGNTELETERDAISERLERLGHLAIRRNVEPCHLTLGTFDAEIPKEVFAAVESNLPEVFILAPIWPGPSPMDQRLNRAVAA